ncbi:MAG: phosphate ABC transporter ATP-binding protein [Magnetococcales bacterium]|nr:phosphate ABC transporter ATP-binding protein [Magnetococcales bacterium]
MHPPPSPVPIAIHIQHLNLWYGTFQALFDINLQVKQGIITSMIGPSGCGKSTILRCVDRINERSGTVRREGRIEVLGHDIYAPEVELAQLRKRVGMVFQRPNPLPLSIFDNVLFGHRIHRQPDERVSRQEEAELAEMALQKVLLWDKVKDRLQQKATVGLSLEEQQKLCIARLLPVKPAILLMDEPCSALDPQGTLAVEELIWELRGDYSILMVTHNMAQARRASEECIFLLMGRVIEQGPTDRLFLTPSQPETANYIEGRYG